MNLPVQITEYDVPAAGSTDLAFEESVFQNVSPVSRSAQARQSIGFSGLGMLVAIVVMVLLGRLAYLQLHQGRAMRVLAEGNRLRERQVLAPRGEIQDRYGEVLARSKPSFRLLLVPVDVPAGSAEQELRDVVDLLHLDPGVVEAVLSKYHPQSVEPLVVAQNLSPEHAILFETRSLEFPGLSATVVPVREFVSPDSFAHVLGTTGAISETDQFFNTAGYSALDIVGKSGIEQTYEPYLKGKDGRALVEVDATGKVVKSLGEVPTAPGNLVTTSLDKGLQEELYKQFSLRPGSKGAAVALQPKTGEVLALVSYPGFNSNLFSEGIGQADYQKLLSDPRLPLFDRALAAQLPPGSTVKMMVGLAGLEEGVVTESTVIVDNGKISIPNQFYPNIVYDYVGWKRTGLGPMTVRSAIARSSDIYFYVVGGGHPSSPVKGLGIGKLAEYYRRFNLGKTTGIDVPGEKPGVVADPEWKARYFQDNPVLGKWYLGDTYHVSIGQGDMLVTPLQIALWTAVFANNGVGMKPHVVTAITDGAGTVVRKNEPEVLVPQVASMPNIQIIQDAMRQTVLVGSAMQLNSLPVTSAGKTGTAQFDNNTQTHAWFTSYAPYEEPEIVVTVLVEGGGEGHAVAEPIAKEALMWWAKNRKQK